jgi:hypothetical protein
MPLGAPGRFNDPGAPYLHPSNLQPGHAIGLRAEGKVMSDDSDLGIVLANAPRLEKAFGRRWGAFLTLMGLYFARKRPGILGLIASLVVMLTLSIEAWLKLRG